MQEPLSSGAERPSWSVLVLDMYHYGDPEHEIAVHGFPTEAQAIEYARRRTRDSLEELRSPEITPDELRRQWYAFGEDCLVIGGTYAGGREIDRFAGQLAGPSKRDWMALQPRSERSRS